MEREEQQQQPEEQKDQMAQDKTERKPDEHNEDMDKTVGNVPDPQAEDTERNSNPS